MPAPAHGYRSFANIANDIKSALDELEYFKDIKAAAVTNYRQIVNLIGELQELPAAAVCIGPGRYEQNGAIRYFEVVIIAIGEFSVTEENAATSAWAAMEKAFEPFLPEVTDTDIRGYTQISNVLYSPGPFEPLEIAGQENCGAFIVTLNATETHEKGIYQ